MTGDPLVDRVLGEVQRVQRDDPTSYWVGETLAAPQVQALAARDERVALAVAQWVAQVLRTTAQVAGAGDLGPPTEAALWDEVFAEGP